MLTLGDESSVQIIIHVGTPTDKHSLAAAIVTGGLFLLSHQTSVIPMARMQS